MQCAGTQASVLPLVVVLLLAGGAAGEPFYQRRDHRDQDKYLQSKGNINVVKDLTDAEFVLSKYGYLRCQVPRRKREALFSRRMLSGMEEGLHLDSCKKTEVRKAILKYQHTYNLPLTGQLDKETMNLMSTSRCGNKDNKDSSPTVLHETIAQVREHHKAAAEASAAQTNRQSSEETPRRLWRRSTRGSHILSTLTGHQASGSTRSHRKFLDEFIQSQRLSRSKRSLDRLRSQLLRRYTPSERRKREVSMWKAKNGAPLGKYRDASGQLFNKQVVRWRLLTTGFSTRIPVVDQRATITLAFRMWSEVIPLKFVEDHESDIHSVDIEIAFGSGPHQNCEHDFDGNGGEIAHSWNVGNMHFDDDESFRSIRSQSADGIYLLRVAVHEIGHVLGLAHTNKSQSIMYAIYRGAQLSPQFELSKDDRKDIQNIYGVCKGSFNTVFDWVRRSPDREFVYNTYFFRDNHYWMYENRANRTRYGDPLYIAREWKGVPSHTDGYVHVWIYNGQKNMDDIYFFKGDNYYKYDSRNDRVYDNWPRKIREDFGPRPDQTEGIPTHVDSVFFDARDKNIYFFKGEHVYVYDPMATDREKGCCVRKRPIREEFPAALGQRPLSSHLDAVYFSYRDNMMYFLKGEDLWRNNLFDPRQKEINKKNQVEYMGKWYDKWFDICDVVVMDKH